MKIFLPLAFVCLLLLRCGPEEVGSTPTWWYNFVSFVDENGNDFFETNADYSKTNLRFSPQYDVLPEDITHQFLDSALVDGIMSYRIGPVSSFFYFAFGNGDIDTLTHEYDYKDEKDVAFSHLIPNWVSKISVMRHYYNGELINTWDFESDPDLALDVVQTNGGFRPDNPFYVFYLPKEPDPDEFTE